ncbi:MAG: porphobilinogen synthase [Conexivisphaerales archaeon]
MKENDSYMLRYRPRRLRRTEEIREMVRETSLNISNFITPVFVREGNGIAEEIKSMPGIYRYTLDKLPSYLASLLNKKLRSIIIFGIPSVKDEMGSMAYSKDGIVPRALRLIKREYPELVVAADVCLCEYTSHGHCGVLKKGSVDNDSTLKLLARAAVEYANSGADIVAPSAMMDGQVSAIREALDENELKDTIIMSYSAKHASAFYGPFREAAESAPSFGDRASYQMQYTNSREAIREIQLDVEEGADIVMVKPALAYLDIISKARGLINIPIAAYNVSGEYSMLKAAARLGWLDEGRAMIEILTAIRRAGADLIITYFSERASDLLRGEL